MIGIPFVCLCWLSIGLAERISASIKDSYQISSSRSASCYPNTTHSQGPIALCCHFLIYLKKKKKTGRGKSKPDLASGSGWGWRASCLLGALSSSKRGRCIIHARQCFPSSSLGSPCWGMAEMEHSPPTHSLHSLSPGLASRRLQGGINHWQHSSETREAELQVCSRQSWKKGGPGPAVVWARLRDRLLQAQFLSRSETLPQPPSPPSQEPHLQPGSEFGTH